MKVKPLLMMSNVSFTWIAWSPMCYIKDILPGAGGLGLQRAEHMQGLTEGFGFFPCHTYLCRHGGCAFHLF